jgi:hypothetical protein
MGEAKLERACEALELFARGMTYKEVGRHLSRLDGKGPVTGTTVTGALWRALYVYGVECPEKISRPFCRLVLAAERADVRFREKYGELLQEMEALWGDHEPPGRAEFSRRHPQK